MAADARVVLSVRLMPDDYDFWMREAAKHGLPGGTAARLILELFAQRLRENGGDYLSALLEFRDALKTGGNGNG